MRTSRRAQAPHLFFLRQRISVSTFARAQQIASFPHHRAVKGGSFREAAHCKGGLDLSSQDRDPCTSTTFNSDVLRQFSDCRWNQTPSPLSAVLICCCLSQRSRLLTRTVLQERLLLRVRSAPSMMP